MSAEIRSKKKLLGFALLGLGLTSLVLAYHFLAAPKAGPGAPISASTAPVQGAASFTSLPKESAAAAGPEARDAVVPHLLVPMEEVAVNANPQPDSLLHEAELERLSGVFLNTVYPSFQSGFRLDLEGRAAIDVFVASMPEGLSSEELATISAMIERQLFTPEADDVAFIITHLYRLEQEQARMLSEGAPITTMAGQLEAQQRLSQLRDDWFGPELAERLFSGTDDVDAATGESPARNPAGGTNTEELPERLTGAQAELAGMESAWAQRYQRFLAEKQFIDNAGLDETEKDQQIEALLRQHYPPEELEAARAFGQQKR